MATPVSHFDTGHTDTVHDSQFDYYGKRLATCSSDGVVRIFAVDQEPAQWVTDLTGHQGPVWQVAWGHPKYGNVIASASFDHTVIVWKEAEDGSWYILHRTDVNLHTGSINSVCFAPAELGLIFAAASSDGNISVHSSDVASGEWSVALVQNDGGLPAHPLGATCVSFCPALEAGALTSARTSKGPMRRLASGGCDQGVRLWSQGPDGVWRAEGPPLAHHTGWVRDIAFAPNLGLPRTCLATAGQDGKVICWAEEASNPGVWKATVVRDFGAAKPAWSVSWSTAGSVLAVAAAGDDDADAVTELFKESSAGKWETVEGAPDVAQE